MSGFNFTTRTRTILAMAREEAARLRHEYVGTEHMLLGIVCEGKGVASMVLANLAVDAARVRDDLEAAVAAGPAQHVTRPELPYTSRAKKALELAMAEAHELQHTYVGSEHLLLGLLREERGIAAQVLVAAGLTIESARTEAVRILASGQDDESPSSPNPAAPRAPTNSRRDAALRGIVIELHHEDGSTLRRELRTIDDAIRFLTTHEHGR